MLFLLLVILCILFDVFLLPFNNDCNLALSLFQYWLIDFKGLPLMIKGLATLEETVAKLFKPKSIEAYLSLLSNKGFSSSL